MKSGDFIWRFARIGKPLQNYNQSEIVQRRLLQCNGYTHLLIKL
jgi:hypothetical protein